MFILGINTATSLNHVALSNDTDFLASTSGHFPTEQLIPVIDELLRYSGKTLREIKMIAVCQGPGAFTGLRVGLTTAKVLATTLKIKLTAVDALEAVAQQFRPAESVVMVIQKAKRTEYNTAVFGTKPTGVTRLTKNLTAEHEIICHNLAKVEGSLWLVGDAAEAVYQCVLKLNKQSRLLLANPSQRNTTALGVILAGIDQHKSKCFADPLKLKPYYSHPPNIIYSSKLDYSKLSQPD